MHLPLFILVSLVSGESAGAPVTVMLARAPDLSPFVVEIAKKEVLAIYDHSNVAIAWSETGEAGSNPRVIVLFRTADSFPIKTDARAVGLALLGSLSSEGDAPATRVLVVFSDRLEGMVSCECPVNMGRALGRAIAHEVGHSLKYDGRHSVAGLMRAEIPTPRWGAPHRRDFYFAAPDAETIRARLTR